MSKIITLFCCILVGFCIGRYFYNQAKRKGIFYKDCVRYIQQLKINVSTYQLEIEQFNKNFIDNSSDTFAKFLVERKLPFKFDSTKSQNLLSFVNNLNVSNSLQLLKHLDFCEQTISADMNDCYQKEVAPSGAYVKIGILCGAIVGILLL